MNTPTICPCCSENMLHHLSGRRDYWFCPSCRQEMPNLDALKRNNSHRQSKIINLSMSLDLSPKMIIA